MDWHNISLSKYLQLKQVFADKELDEVEKGIEAVSILFDCDANKLMITDFNNKLQQVKKVLSNKIPKSKVKAKYGEYQLVVEPTLITTSQFMDISTFRESGDIVGILSCILIPKNHVYNDGYSIDEVRNYIMELPITDALGILSFFTEVSLLYITHSLQFLVKKGVKNKQQKKEIKNKIKQLQEMISACCHSF